MFEMLLLIKDYIILATKGTSQQFVIGAIKIPLIIR